MAQTGKRFYLAVMILLALLLLFSGFYKFLKWNATSAKADDGSIKISIAPASSENGAASVIGGAEGSGRIPKFRTKENIRQEYGRLESVSLKNGKNYEGAIISIDRFYTIVTVDGVVKIPMSEVRVRKIIR